MTAAQAGQSFSVVAEHDVNLSDCRHIYDSILPRDSFGNVIWVTAVLEMVASKEPLEIGLNRQNRRRVEHSPLGDSVLGTWLQKPIAVDSPRQGAIDSLLIPEVVPGVWPEEAEAEPVNGVSTSLAKSIVFSLDCAETFLEERLTTFDSHFQSVSSDISEFCNQFFGRLTRHFLPLSHAPPVFS